MAKTISSLLVGIGLDFDEKSTREVESSFDRVKSGALKLGAVVAGAFGIGQLTSGFSASNDALGKFSETYGLIANDVSAFDRALQKSGGQAGDFISQIEGIERLRAATKVGDFGFIEAASKAGIDTRSIIDATNATEAYLALANQFAGANQQQRLNMADAIGLDPSSIRLLSTGRSAVAALVAEEKNRRPVTRDMLDMSGKFNRQWQDINTNIGAYADKISVRVLPAINDLLSITNDWLDANKGLSESGIVDFFSDLGDELGLVAVALAAIAAPSLLAGLGSVLKISGKIAKPLVKKSLIGAAGVGGYSAGGIIHDALPTAASDAIGRGVATVLATFGNDQAMSALNAEQAAGASRVQAGISADDSPKIPNIYLTNKTIVDGRVIEDVTRRVIDASVSTMADELSSSVR